MDKRLLFILTILLVGVIAIAFRQYMYSKANPSATVMMGVSDTNVIPLKVEALQETESSTVEALISERRPTETIKSVSLFETVDESLLGSDVVNRFFNGNKPEQYAIVTIDEDSFRELIRDYQSSGVKKATLPMFDGKTLDLIIEDGWEKIEGPTNGMASFRATVAEEKFSYVRLVSSTLFGMTGVIRSKQGNYTIQPSANLPYHYLWNVDTKNNVIND